MNVGDQWSHGLVEPLKRVVPSLFDAGPCLSTAFGRGERARGLVHFGNRAVVAGPFLYGVFARWVLNFVLSHQTFRYRLDID